jgi:hypothetical protein
MLSISIIFVKKNNLQICHQCIHFLCLFEQFAKSLSDPSVEQVYLNTDPAKDKKGGKIVSIDDQQIRQHYNKYKQAKVYTNHLKPKTNKHIIYNRDLCSIKSWNIWFEHHRWCSLSIFDQTNP